MKPLAAEEPKCGPQDRRAGSREPRPTRARRRPRRAGAARLRGHGRHRRRRGAGQRGHRRRRQHLSRLHRRHRRQRARAPPPDLGEGAAGPGGEGVGRLVHVARARRAVGAFGRAAAGARACTACSSTRAAPRRSRARCGSPSAHTGKYEFVSFWGGFHGKTMGALSLMGSTFKDKLGPMVPGAHQVPYADCYRCPSSSSYPSCGLACAEFARKQVKIATRRRGRRRHRRADAGHRRQRDPAQGFLPAVRVDRRRARRAAHRRRDDHRLRPHRHVVGRRPLRRAAPTS